MTRKQKEERAIKKFNKAYAVFSTGCWNWLKYTSTKGYGRFYFRGRQMYAHRVAWLIFRGYIPRGLCVLHKCDNPRCVNPKHLFLGTTADNNLDRDHKGRTARGDRQGQAKLTWRDVDKIRHSGTTNKYLARIYGVSPSSISKIKSNVNWRANKPAVENNNGEEQ